MLQFLIRLFQEPHKVFWRFLQCLFCWGVPKPESNIEDAGVILTQAMCDLTNGKISEINHVMAGYIRTYRTRLNIPVVAQGDLVPALKQKGIPIFAQTRSLPVYGFLRKGYFNSYDVAKWQKEICHKEGWNRVMIVAFVPHIWRACWIYKRLGFGVIIPANMPRMTFQKELLQWRWRRAITAYPFELLFRLYSLYKGYI